MCSILGSIPCCKPIEICCFYRQQTCLECCGFFSPEEMTLQKNIYELFGAINKREDSVFDTCTACGVETIEKLEADLFLTQLKLAGSKEGFFQKYILTRPPHYEAMEKLITTMKELFQIDEDKQIDIKEFQYAMQAFAAELSTEILANMTKQVKELYEQNHV